MSAETGVIIVGGATKCGSTSLFEYLADHPQVARPALKESRAFLTAGGVLPDLDACMARYEEVAMARAGRLAMDSCSEYLYSASALAAIRRGLGARAHVVFIVRDPVARLWSLYRHQQRFVAHPPGYAEWLAGQQREWVPEAIDADRYGLLQGRYLPFLAAWDQAFGVTRVHVLSLEALSRAPVRTMQRLAGALGIDGEFYSTYRFQTHNRTEATRSPVLHGVYRRSVRRLRELTVGHPQAWAALRSVKRLVDPVYRRINIGGDPGSRATDEQRETLESYYEAELRWLAAAGPDGQLKRAA